MKVGVLVASMFLALATLGCPPPSAANTIVGVEAGVSLANLRGEDVFNNEIQAGGAAGLFVEYPLSPIFSLQPEFMWVAKGAHYKSGNLESTQHMDYLELTVPLRATLVNDSAWKPNAFFGPALGILLRNKIEDGAVIDLKDGSKSVDFSLVMGGGVDYQFEVNSVRLNVRYDLGLISTFNSDVDKDVKNSVISIMLGYGRQF